MFQISRIGAMLILGQQAYLALKRSAAINRSDSYCLREGSKLNCLSENQLSINEHGEAQGKATFTVYGYHYAQEDIAPYRKYDISPIGCRYAN